MKGLKNILKNAISLSLVLILVCGIAYPMALTATGQVLFKDKAEGSFIEVDGEKVGAKNIGQQFTEPYFFKGRVSSVNYNTYTEKDKEDGTYEGPSSGSFNYAPSNPELKKRVEASVDEFLKNNPEVNREDIPADLMTASGSGLDPNISVKSAEIQIPAISKASGISEEKLNKMIKENTDSKFLGIFGEERVNVLELNIDVYKSMNKNK